MTCEVGEISPVAVEQVIIPGTGTPIPEHRYWNTAGKATQAEHYEQSIMIDMSDNRSVNDIGGLLDEPFNPEEHDYEPWEKRVHALRELLAVKGLLSADVLRKNIELLGEEKYKRLSYYERWIHSISQAMLEQGALSNKELADKINEVKSRYE